jgi:putative polyhydroxyalkanoate system protein
MPKLTIEHPHSLPIDEVKRRLEDLANRMSQKYSIDAEWTSSTEAKVKRTGVTGTITCAADKVVVFLDLSFALAPIKGKVESRVRQELSQILV